jgi:hypothetical protein
MAKDPQASERKLDRMLSAELEDWKIQKQLLSEIADMFEEDDEDECE